LKEEDDKRLKDKVFNFCKK